MIKEPKELTEKQKQKIIKDLKEKILNLSSVKDKNNKEMQIIADSNINIAYLLADDRKNYNEAIEKFLLGLNYYKETDKKSRIASIYGAVGSICYAKKDFSNSSQYYKESINVLKDSKLKNEIMIGKKGLGLSLLGLNEEERGITYLLEAADICAEEPDLDNYMEIITILKLFFKEKEDWENSIELEKKALKVLEIVKNSNEITLSLYEIGIIYSYLKQYENSIVYLKKGVNSAIKSKNNQLLYNGISLVAEILFHMKKIEESKLEYLKALSLASYLDIKNEVDKTTMLLTALGTNHDDIHKAIEKGKNEQEFNLESKN